jgi:phosphatidylserine/phosphatidylglycerophosphate/cardiolipin synthase-like enzyme
MTVELELAVATAKLATWPPMGFYLNPDIRRMLVAAVDAAEVSAHVRQCYYSDDQLNLALIRAMRDRGVNIGFIADEGQCRHGWMSEPLSALVAWGADVRIYSPQGGVSALMHAKAWLIDDCLAILGSCSVE